MSEHKPHQFRPPLYHKEGSGQERTKSRDPNADRQREQQGWEAYRKWLSSMTGQPRSRRAPIDHSVYSWKGYHNWADHVRQTWKSEDK
jgi:hypothetical protein